MSTILIFVVKNKVSKLQPTLRTSLCILSWLQKACLFPINSLNILSNLYKQKNLHPAIRSSNNRQTSQTPKFQAQIILNKKKEEEEEQEQEKIKHWLVSLSDLSFSFTDLIGMKS